ncbi:putative lipid II flippase FtsW [Pueribacillus theae]|uniref:Probable peptidoglycan glycosyltransferase FtsW n=1 Tax=Pueribacillus theae TaxID=2171751 RepID=A0A2U1K7W8_9BACI|nr:putative lipid II flippase FtsW [Pueribacillus theae]PWA13375.1 putative lipid II flippase FtsW [Pueribacillus theae]
MLKKLLKNYDYSLIIAMFLLIGFGIIMIYSASMVVTVTKFDPPRPSNYFFIKQLQWLAVGMVPFILTMVLPYQVYKRFMKMIIIVSLALLLIVLFAGSTFNNGQRWISFAGITIQPSEFIKVGLIIYLAAIFSKKQSYITNFKKAVVPPLIVISVFFFLVAKQPDLGTAVIIAGVSGVMIICSGMKGKHLFSLIGLCFVAFSIIATALPIFLSDEQLSRISGAYDPFSDPQDSGYHLINSYLAIASGGITGRGLGDSIQKYGFLPEPYTDFIMAIVIEELGVFGTIFVIGLLAFIVYKGFMIGIRCQDTFGSLLAIGISSLIAIQSFVNLGTVSGLLPITGAPLPFISYGGSFLVLAMTSMGILINISSFVNMKRKALQPAPTKNKSEGRIVYR